jgi:hypothetical protein
MPIAIDAARPRKLPLDMRVHSNLCAFVGWFAMLSATERIGDRSRTLSAQVGVLLVALVMALALVPQSAQAHGAIDPSASSYLARVKHVPSGVSAKVVDGDLRLWLQVPPGKTVFVLDYQGVPYLRFRDGRVWANEDSQMYYFDQTPAENPPPGLKQTAPVHWLQVGSGLSYQWHDGRLHAFALEAIVSGASYAGSWQIPILINGRRSAVTGTLWYRGGPSIVWLWPIAILILCVLAGSRLRDARLDALIARLVAALTLLGIALAAVGRDLHGRPGLSPVGLVELALVGIPTVWTVWRVAHRRTGALTYFLVSIVAVWEALSLIPTLFNGYVLLAVGPFLGRLATIICLGGAIALILPAVRLFGQERDAEAEEHELATDSAAPTLV